MLDVTEILNKQQQHTFETLNSSDILYLLNAVQDGEWYPALQPTRGLGSV